LDLQASKSNEICTQVSWRRTGRGLQQLLAVLLVLDVGGDLQVDAALVAGGLEADGGRQGAARAATQSARYISTSAGPGGGAHNMVHTRGVCRYRAALDFTWLMCLPPWKFMSKVRATRDSSRVVARHAGLDS
jgi:hypothetical protein